MAKKKLIPRKEKLKKHKFQDMSPSDPLLAALPDMRNLPYEPSKSEKEFRKLLQGTIIHVSQEILREQRDEILARAIEIIKRDHPQIKVTE